MDDLNLQSKLTRKMTSNDYCHQRIFSCIPLIWKLYGDYMSETKNYNFSSVFLEVIKDWNNERNKDLEENFKYDIAITELNDFYTLLCQIYDIYYNRGSFDSEICQKIYSITLTNYKYISAMCRICIKNDNRSKVLGRLANLKKKTTKLFNGVITIEQFMENEIKPQKEFLDIFIRRLKLFDKNQFCIFMLCYDIRKTNKTIFVKKKYDTERHFLI